MSAGRGGLTGVDPSQPDSKGLAMRICKPIALSTLVSGVAALALHAGPAQAAEISPKGAQALADALGAKGAGAYFDASRDAMVVAVTDQAAAQQVRAAGAIARVVEHSTDELESVDAKIAVAANVPGMAWAVDPVENKVVVSVDESVDAAELKHVEAGLAGMIVTGSIGLLAPAGTPLYVVEQITRAATTALADPAYQQLLKEAAMEPIAAPGPENLRRILSEDIALWSPVVKELGLKLD